MMHIILMVISLNSIQISKRRLNGTVHISGSKNAAIPIICASLLTSKIKLYNVPNILDIKRLLNILSYLGSKIKRTRKWVYLDNKNVVYKPLIIEECSLIRGSYYLIPIMLYLFGRCEILLPGGCKIGKRPIDEHINVIKAMGYIVKEEGSFLFIRNGKSLETFRYSMNKESVGASINAILLSLKSSYAVLDNLLIEPECYSLLEMLRVIGFKINAFNKRCVFKGVYQPVKYAKYRIIPDRMEAMTYIALGILCGNVKVKGCNPSDMKYPLDLLISNGYDVKICKNMIIAKEKRGKAFDISTRGYPFFPTDAQPIFGVILAYSIGSAKVEENIFENRMQIYKDLINMGADITVIDNKAFINGIDKLNEYTSCAFDLRHGASLLLLALKNGGVINNLEVVERGYDSLYKKLKSLGARVTFL